MTAKKREDSLANVLRCSAPLPGIQEQLEYVQRIRKEMMCDIKQFQPEIAMLLAIEQSLIAVKIFSITKIR